MIDTHLQGPATNGYGAVPVMRCLQTLFGRAFSTLTTDTTAPADGSTVTIGGKVYTFKTTLTPTEGQVLINVTAAAAMLNLIRAINHTGTPGTDYSVAAADPSVTADAAVTAATSFKVRAINDGVAGNSVTTASSTSPNSHMTWTSTTLAGGRASSTTSGVDRVLLKTNGASVTNPLIVEITEIAETAFNGTSPVVSIISTNLAGGDPVTDFAISDIVANFWKTKVIIADRIYYVTYTAATGSPSAGNIYSYVRVSGPGTP